MALSCPQAAEKDISKQLQLAGGAFGFLATVGWLQWAVGCESTIYWAMLGLTFPVRCSNPAK